MICMKIFFHRLRQGPQFARFFVSVIKIYFMESTCLLLFSLASSETLVSSPRWITSYRGRDLCSDSLRTILFKLFFLKPSRAKTLRIKSFNEESRLETLTKGAEVMFAVLEPSPEKWAAENFVPQHHLCQISVVNRHLWWCSHFLSG